MGRKKKGEFEYRLRWDDIIFEPGKLKVVAYRNGQKWAQDEVVTTGNATKIEMSADRERIKSDGKDLSFIAVQVTDKKGNIVPLSHNSVKFKIEGPGEIVATDNGDPTCFIPFQSTEREVFNGMTLVIIKSKAGIPGKIKLTAESPGLTIGEIFITGQ